MLDVFNTPNKVGANVQYFYQDSMWTKPRGANQIYMMLIGGGGNDSVTLGGGSGSITTWWGSASNVPDSLIIHPSTGNADNTTVSYLGTSTSVLIQANAATTSTGGTAFTANQFCNTGFFQSVAGQTGSSIAVTASTITFLGAGSHTASQGATGNYGYSIPSVGSGFFQTSPIIVGVGSTGGTTARNGPIGCGAGGTGGLGGPGLVIIASY